MTDSDSLSPLLATLSRHLQDRYGLQRELGRGGMATVFLAEDLKHQRLVAIKVLHPDVAEAIGLERFQREIDIAAKLQHPHILPLYDSGSAGGYLYYVMPFVEGESLRDLLDREKQLSQEDVVRLTGQVASALGYAHSHGVVHRDIKPENIMLSGGTAVVADFGIARALTAPVEQQLTQAGTVIGTPAYMSPEQAMGRPDLDGRSDQYSLACVVYEMLVGEPPFTGATAQAIMARHSLDHVSPPSIVRESIPETMETAVLRALSKTPADRYATVIMFAEALGAPSSVTAALRRRTTASQRARHRRLDWRVVAGVGALVLLGGGWFAFGRRFGSGGGTGVSGPDPQSIAVLYFEDRSPGHGLGYLADGLTEVLIHELSALKQLQVVSANGVRPYRDHPVSPDSLQRALKIGTIVQGTIAQVGDSLQLDVALSNAATGVEQGSTRLRLPRRNVFALQDTLAKSVSVFLRQAIGQEVQLRTARAGTSNEAAWELVQQAEQARKGLEPLLAAGDAAAATRQLDQADSLLAKAAALDAGWAAPLIARGWLAYEQRRIVGFDKGPASEWTQRGLDYAAQALRLQTDTAEALRLRGTMRYVRWLFNLDPSPLTPDQLLAAAERDLRAGAAPENFNRAAALALLSHLLLRKSQPADGKLAALQAWELDPYLSDAAGVLWRLYSSSLDLEDGVEAQRWCQEGLRRFPKNPFFTECQISLNALAPNALAGRRVDVPTLWKLLDQNVALYGPNVREYRRRRGALLVAMGLARAGLKDSAQAVALRARAGADIDPTHDLQFVEILLRNVLGDREEALSLLGQYLATNPQDRATFERDNTWWLRGLRDDPRFKALVGRGR